MIQNFASFLAMNGTDLAIQPTGNSGGGGGGGDGGWCPRGRQS